MLQPTKPFTSGLTVPDTSRTIVITTDNSGTFSQTLTLERVVHVNSALGVGTVVLPAAQAVKGGSIAIASTVHGNNVTITDAGGNTLDIFKAQNDRAVFTSDGVYWYFSDTLITA